MSPPSPPPEPTRWAPLVALADPGALAQPQVPALRAFWTRVRTFFEAAEPALGPHLDEKASAMAAVSPDVLEVLRRPLSVRMLQDLHVMATRDQTAARAVTADGGFKYVPFPYGRLKDRPNHLSIGGRVVREFAPPERVPHELGVMLAAHDAIPASMPEVRAAWLVHALLAVHPFVDGNGRVARLLASLPFLAGDMPVVWGENAERGGGWREALDEAKLGDQAPLARLLAHHQERVITRLLLELDLPLAQGVEPALALARRLDAARAAFAPQATAARTRLGPLVDVLSARLSTFADALGCERRLVLRRDAGALARTHARAAGVRADRRESGALVRLDVPGGSLRLGLVPLGWSGTGAWAAFATLRPRVPLGPSLPVQVVWPDEPDDAAGRRLGSWVERVTDLSAGALAGEM